jgi:epoxyqueuosine reductase QueG
VDSQETANYEQVRQFAMGQGATLFGVADMASYRNALTGLSAGTADRLTRAVSLAFRLSDAILEDLEDGPTDLYFFHYQRVNILLDLCALRVAAHIQSSGWEAIPVPASQIVDWERQRGHVSHKHVAQQAGLGWIGRNNLLVNPDLGARLRLVTILTDMPLRADVPLALDCGECMACLPSCPSGSIKARPEDFDHHGCFAQIRKMVKEARISQNICGLCVKACRGRRLASEGKP